MEAEKYQTGDNIQKIALGSYVCVDITAISSWKTLNSDSSATTAVKMLIKNEKKTKIMKRDKEPDQKYYVQKTESQAQMTQPRN